MVRPVEVSVGERRKRMLFLSQMFPLPVQSGTQHRTYHLLARLARQFDVTFLTLAADAGWEAHLAELGRHARRVVAVVPANKRSRAHRAAYKILYWLRRIVLADSSDRFYNTIGNVNAAIQRELATGEYDVLVAEYWFWDARIFTTPALKVIDANDVQTMRVERLLERTTNAVDRWLAPRLVRRYRAMEQAAVRRADVIVATTPRDRDVFAAWAPERDVVCIPTGLDTDYFAPQPGIVPDARDIVFYGSLANPMNRDAVQYLVHDILPQIRSRIPGARLTLVGAFAGPDVQALAAADPGITLTGYLEDVRPALARAAVVVCPLRFGYGIRGRIYELMAMQLPVVATPVAVEGMELESGDGLLLAADPAAFADAVARLAQDPRLRDELGRRGRALAVERMSIAATYDRLASHLLHRLAMQNHGPQAARTA
jgi:glycosyltransferase involved in cell wall biosynthesis